MTWIGIVLAALVAYGAFRAFLIEPHDLEIVAEDVFFDNLPGGLDGTRIVLLTDFHLTGFGDAERRVIEAVRAARPDILCLTGDYIDREENFQFLVPYLMELARGRATYAVLGNHDYQEKLDTDRLREDIRRAGTRLLVNDSVTEYVRGVPIEIVGVDDPHTQRADLEQAMKRVKGERFMLLLAHSPDILQDAGAKEADLILCGHTHGGQIRLPIVGPLRTNTRVGRIAAAGLAAVDGTQIYVSRGLGESMMPVRFCCRPEVSVLTLRKGSG